LYKTQAETFDMLRRTVAAGKSKNSASRLVDWKLKTWIRNLDTKHESPRTPTDINDLSNG
jgi:hypothetical protein